MAKLEPATGASSEVLDALNDNVPYRARLKEIVEFRCGEYMGNPSNDLILQWEVLDEEGQPTLEVRDFVKWNIGKQRNGQPQKLRQLCNAIAGKRGVENVAWIEDDEPPRGVAPFSFSYDGTNVADVIRPGIEVMFTGAARERQDKSGFYFAFNTYGMINRTQQRAPRRAAPARLTPPDQSAYDRAVSNVDPDDVPF